jgi:hypothetical protein
MDSVHNRRFTPALRAMTRARSPGHGPFYRWFSFFLGLGLIGLVIFGLLPELQRIPAVGPGAQIIIDSGIEAGAFYYTDVAKVPEAESFIRGAGVGVGGGTE